MIYDNHVCCIFTPTASINNKVITLKRESHSGSYALTNLLNTTELSHKRSTFASRASFLNQY